ncbi:McrC family protein [Psychrobacillus sp. NPDC096623]|uniref:McrC family protein n=1 Tax=Psychrobacillus sp. NPDC096623 TaxID=3364492 RepID=UPI0038084541
MEQTFKVPIRNLFCLLSYVNEMPEFVDSLNDVDEDLITYDFLAKRFLAEVDSLNRRGLLRSYVTREEHTNRLGGKILINESLGYLMARKPLMVCEKDEYSPDILFNQMMKATLVMLSKNRYIKDETRRRSFQLIEYLVDVDEVALTKEVFSKSHFHRHTVHYKRMIHIARLLHELTLLSHKQGNWSLFSAQLNETSMNQLFEKFLFHFYSIEQKEYRVKVEQMQWKLEGNTALLPSMRTDISLIHKREPKKIVMDAKFYKNVFQEFHGKASLHSHNMYQLFTYLMHQSEDIDVQGVLIYPYNGVDVDETYQWNERVTMKVMTVNLDESWKRIYERLIGLSNV